MWPPFSLIFFRWPPFKVVFFFSVTPPNPTNSPLPRKKWTVPYGNHFVEIRESSLQSLLSLLCATVPANKTKQSSICFYWESLNNRSVLNTTPKNIIYSQCVANGLKSLVFCGYRVTSCYHHTRQLCFHQHFATLGQKPAGAFVTWNNMHRRNKMIRNNLTGLMITRQHTFKNNHWERDVLNFVGVIHTWNVSLKYISNFSRNYVTTSVEERSQNLVKSNEFVNAQFTAVKDLEI